MGLTGLKSRCHHGFILFQKPQEETHLLDVSIFCRLQGPLPPLKLAMIREVFLPSSLALFCLHPSNLGTHIGSVVFAAD